MNPSTAILFFSRSATAELQHKPFAGIGRKQDLDLKTCLIRQTLLSIKKTGIPFFHIDEHLQRGQSFAEKLANAFESVFEQGFENVIAIGNDCPALKARHLLAAQKMLEAGQMPLAGDIHGGACLIGIRKTAYCRDQFLGLRWQTKFLFRDLARVLSARLLPELFIDLNRIKDAGICLRTLDSSASIYRLLLQILNPYFRLRRFYRYSFSHLAPIFSGLRAPPPSAA